MSAPTQTPRTSWQTPDKQQNLRTILSAANTRRFRLINAKLAVGLTGVCERTAERYMKELVADGKLSPAGYAQYRLTSEGVVAARA